MVIKHLEFLRIRRIPGMIGNGATYLKLSVIKDKELDSTGETSRVRTLTLRERTDRSQLQSEYLSKPRRIVGPWTTLWLGPRLDVYHSCQ